MDAKIQDRVNVFNKLYSKPINYDFPNLIDVELTNNCNLNCNMCSRQIMTREKGYMSRDTFRKIIDECKIYKPGIRFIRWGEPFLHQHILDFCKIVKDNNIPLHITNNGLAISESQMRYLIDIELDSIIFSMQGLTKEEYEEIRKAPYDILETNIKKLVELRGNKKKPFIHITTTVDNLEGKEKFINKWTNIVDKVTVGKTNWSRLTSNTIPKYSKCKEVYQKLSVDWDGIITACCGDYDRYLSLGNIDTKSLHWIWSNSVKLAAIREILDNMDHKCLTLCSKCYPAHQL